MLFYTLVFLNKNKLQHFQQGKKKPQQSNKSNVIINVITDGVMVISVLALSR